MLEAQAIYARGGTPEIRASPGATLGRSLHCLVPEDSFDRGPQVDIDERVLVADIRIDNREELRRQLNLSLADAKQLSDAELLNFALRRWDTDALSLIVGDYSFAQWEPRRRRLLLARDYLGQRPLHYHRGNEFFAFSSMPKGLHALPQVPRALNRRAATDFLALMPEAPGESFFDQIKTVPPGHHLVAERHDSIIKRHWNPQIRPLRLSNDEEYAAALREQLDQAVRSRLRGCEDGVAAHLSGGLDSASVTATAARQISAAGRIIAYTSVPKENFEGSNCSIANEGPNAAAVASMYPNIEHVLVRTGASSPVASLARNFSLYERPYPNLCNGVWIDAINDDAQRRGLRVMLTGTLGNASFSFDGMPLLAELLHKGRIRRLTRELYALRRRGMEASTIAAAMLGPFMPEAAWRAIQGLRGRAAGFADYSLMDPKQAQDPAFRASAKARGLDPAGRPSRSARATQIWMLNRIDSGNYNKGTLAGWGIDKRDPTADRRLVEFMLSLPADQYLLRGEKRSIARRASRDRLPAALLQETRKGYQSADWFEGFDAAREQLRTEAKAIANDPAAAAVIDVNRLVRLIEKWPTSDAWMTDKVNREYRIAALRAISLGHFMRTVGSVDHVPS